MSRARDIADSKPSLVSDQSNTSTGYLDLPSGTTAQRPTLDNAGGTRFNSDSGSLEFYDGANWVTTNLIPTINSITGTIYAGASSTLTLSVTNATDTIDVKYYEGITLLATDSGVTVTNGSASSTVPSAVYGQTAGDTISIQVFNVNGTPSSNNIDKTVAAVPSGGTKTTSGNYHIHTFTSSSNFVVPSGLTLSNVEYLVVAGGGGGGSGAGGGGGAGGLLSGSLSVSTQSYSITIGAGGNGGSPAGNVDVGSTGTSSSGLGISTVGGGGGGYSGGQSASGTNGGSGGGGTGSGGSGTSGQGFAGGNAANYGSPGYPNGGGGGASEVGGNASSTSVAGDGGDGSSTFVGGNASNTTAFLLAAVAGTDASNNATTSSSSGTLYIAGGGGGGTYETYTAGSGGLGGGGNGSSSGSGTSGTVNTGGGGGGATRYSGTGGNGGSGIVIIRYQLP